MGIKRYNKLVRDHIPRIIRARGLRPVIHTVRSIEYGTRLADKPQEEVKEYLKSRDPEELADILEVVDALAVHHDLQWSSLMRLKRNKRRRRGGFKRRIVLDEVRDAK